MLPMPPSSMPLPPVMFDTLPLDSSASQMMSILGRLDCLPYPKAVSSGASGEGQGAGKEWSLVPYPSDDSHVSGLHRTFLCLLGLPVSHSPTSSVRSLLSSSTGSTHNQKESTGDGDKCHPLPWSVLSRSLISDSFFIQVKVPVRVMWVNRGPPRGVPQLVLVTQSPIAHLFLCGDTLLCVYCSPLTRASPALTRQRPRLLRCRAQPGIPSTL